MQLEFTAQERSLLLELIEHAEKKSIQSLDHTDTREFKDILRNRLDVLASAKEKIERYQAAA